MVLVAACGGNEKVEIGVLGRGCRKIMVSEWRKGVRGRIVTRWNNLRELAKRFDRWKRPQLFVLLTYVSCGDLRIGGVVGATEVGTEKRLVGKRAATT